MFTLRINDNHYPMITAPVEWHDGGWRTSILPSVTPEVSEEIDHNHWEDWPGGIVDTIYFAMVDGWSSDGTMREDDPDLEPIYWAIEWKGQPIGRDALEELLNPGEVAINLLVGTDRRGDPVETRVEFRRFGGHEAEQFVLDYADKHGLEINYLDRYGSLLVAQVA
jgi:hypothetical protein